MTEQYTQYTDLIGKIATKVRKFENQELIFEMSDGRIYKFYHSQDCCESVSIDDIVGELSDLENSPILMAEEIIHGNNEDPEGIMNHPEYRDSFTWTFYKFQTVKGYVTVKWYGESNGYYSESVDFEEVK